MTTTDADSREQVRAAIAPRTLSWLTAELAEWSRDGLLTGAQADAIAARYTASARPALRRLVVRLGTVFLAIGLLWMVATNLDRLSPLLRFAVVCALWLGFVALGEAARSQATPGSGPHAAAGVPIPAAVWRMLAAAGFGAVIFQAAQSLQVPAYESRLVGFWALGALAYAYATRSRGALGVALAAGLAWFGWFVGESAGSQQVGVVMALAGSVAATALAVLHDTALRQAPGEALGNAAGGPLGEPAGFGRAWRLAGGIVALLGVFIAALPAFSLDAAPWPTRASWLLGAVAVVTVAALLAVLLPRRITSPGAPGVPGSGTGATARRGPLGEIAAAVLIAAAAGALAWWRPDGGLDALLQQGGPTAEQWARTGVAVLVFVAAAGWQAGLGAARDQGELTAVALAALVVFVTVQSFAVFAPIVSGATLFLVVGAVLVGTGLGAERLRRRLGDRRRPGSSRRRGDRSRPRGARRSEVRP
ncbi:DUF2157 domain-containing protein [Piscicoccus intestinalis]|uniref:DUF2157 domain-containing protein n=1 Tax=Piscicoccus intestinalis TaxID=746033 RepID=UPI000837B130|nr:DUF2157 domain-containing protein [Piscicoccus intestinalis]